MDPLKESASTLDGSRGFLTTCDSAARPRCGPRGDVNTVGVNGASDQGSSLRSAAQEPPEPFPSTVLQQSLVRWSVRVACPNCGYGPIMCDPFSAANWEDYELGCDWCNR